VARTNFLNPTRFDHLSRFQTHDNGVAAASVASPVTVASTTAVGLNLPDYTAQVWVYTTQTVWVAESDAFGTYFVVEPSTQTVFDAAGMASMFFKGNSGASANTHFAIYLAG
jgi:hypothetical protein